MVNRDTCDQHMLLGMNTCDWDHCRHWLIPGLSRNSEFVFWSERGQLSLEPHLSKWGLDVHLTYQSGSLITMISFISVFGPTYPVLLYMCDLSQAHPHLLPSYHKVLKVLGSSASKYNALALLDICSIYSWRAVILKCFGSPCYSLTGNILLCYEKTVVKLDMNYFQESIIKVSFPLEQMCDVLLYGHQNWAWGPKDTIETVTFIIHCSNESHFWEPNNLKTH